MKLLALDTSTERLCLALCLDGRVLAHEEPGGALSSARLLTAAEALLRSNGLCWTNLDGLGFGQGPGAFSGLRGACAAVQGLALGLNRPAVPIPSLQIVAEAARRHAVASGLLEADQPCLVRVAVDARMGEVYDGQESWNGRRWKSAHPPCVRPPEGVSATWLEAGTGVEAYGSGEAGGTGDTRGKPVLHAGSGLALFSAPVQAALAGNSAAWWPQEEGRAAALGHCAEMAWADGFQVDAGQVHPLYVRDRVALTTAERRAALGPA